MLLKKLSLLSYCRKNKEDIEQLIDFMRQILSNMGMKYSFIEKHAYSFVKSIEKFRHLILGKYTEIRTPLPSIKFCCPKTFFLENWPSGYLKYKNMI